MKKQFIYGTIFFILGCSSKNYRLYDKLSSLPMVDAIYETSYTKTDSLSYDTVKVYSGIDTFVIYNTIIDRNNDSKQVYMFFNFTSEITDIDTLISSTVISYDIKGDSISYYEESKFTEGRRKSFEINGRQYSILKQPRMVFAKSQPNLIEFYNNELGCLLVLSNSRIKRLKGFVDFNSNPDLKDLIVKIEADKKFYDYPYLYLNSFL